MSHDCEMKKLLSRQLTYSRALSWNVSDWDEGKRCWEKQGKSCRLDLATAENAEMNVSANSTLWNTQKNQKTLKIDNFSREIVVGQNNVNKIDNFSREIEVGQNNVNKYDKFSREIEVGKMLKN